MSEQKPTTKSAFVRNSKDSFLKLVHSVKAQSLGNKHESNPEQLSKVTNIAKYKNVQTAQFEERLEKKGVKINKAA